MSIETAAKKSVLQKKKSHQKRPATLAVLRGIYAILVCLAELAVVVYWINGLVFCEGERMNILVAFRYIFRVFGGLRTSNLYTYFSGLLIAIIYIVLTVLFLTNVFRAFLFAKRVVAEMGSTNTLGSEDLLDSFRGLQLSFYYAALKVVSFILVASFFANCRLPQETIWMFAGVVVIKLVFPFLFRPLTKKRIVGELLNLLGTALLFFAWIFVAFWMLEPWAQMIWDGAIALSRGVLKGTEYQSLVPFLFSYFVQPVFMMIFFIKAYGLLKALFNSLELGGNKKIFSCAKSLLIFFAVLAVLSWAVAEAANGFAGTGTANIFLRCYQATRDYHLLILCAAACVTAYYFPAKGKKEKTMI